jgi:hypothetical protein
VRHLHISARYWVPSIARNTRPVRHALTILPLARRNCRDVHSPPQIDLLSCGPALCYLDFASGSPSSSKTRLVANKQGSIEEEPVDRIDGTGDGTVNEEISELIRIAHVCIQVRSSLANVSFVARQPPACLRVAAMLIHPLQHSNSYRQGKSCIGRKGFLWVSPSLPALSQTIGSFSFYSPSSFARPMIARAKCLRPAVPHSVGGGSTC